jgi:hypothetical protein
MSPEVEGSEKATRPGGRTFEGGVIHDGQADFPGFLGPQPHEELVEAGFRTVLAAEPNRPSSDEIAHHDAVLLALAHGDFVDANDFGIGSRGAAKLLAHVQLVEFLDGLPIQCQLFGHRLHRGIVTTSPH